jgi:hypothetical protein
MSCSPLYHEYPAWCPAHSGAWYLFLQWRKNTGPGCQVRDQWVTATAVQLLQNLTEVGGRSLEFILRLCFKLRISLGYSFDHLIIPPKFMTGPMPAKRAQHTSYWAAWASVIKAGALGKPSSAKHLRQHTTRYKFLLAVVWIWNVPQRGHGLKVWFPAWCYWEVVETSEHWACVLGRNCMTLVSSSLFFGTQPWGE